MANILYLETDPTLRQSVTSHLVEAGHTLLPEEADVTPELVIVSAEAKNVEENIQAVLQAVERFPDTPLAVLSSVVTAAFIYKIAEFVEVVTPRQSLDNGTLKWEEYASKLESQLKH